MTSASLFSTNDKIDLDSDKTNKNIYTNNNPISPFKAFDSVLYMSEFLGNEDNQTSEISSKENENATNISPNLYKENFSDDISNLREVSPSLEKCLTSELLDSIANDSNNKKKCQILKFNNYNSNDNLSNEKVNKLKISKKLFNEDMIGDTKKNDKKGKTLYEEIINGFKYQLKFIENSVNNILPKSYKKMSNKNIEKNNPKITSSVYPDEYSSYNYIYDNSLYQNENDNYSNNDKIDYNYNPALENKYILNNTNGNGNAKQTKHQIHKLKKTDNYYGNWICGKCNSFNRGYRKTCVNCGYY